MFLTRPQGACFPSWGLKTLHDLFVETLKDIHYAEKAILKALPKMAKKASSEDLAAAFEAHFEETEGQVERQRVVRRALIIDLSTEAQRENERQAAHTRSNGRLLPYLRSALPDTKPMPGRA